MRIVKNPLDAWRLRTLNDESDETLPFDTVVRQEVQNNNSNIDSNARTDGDNDSGNVLDVCETYVPSTLIPEPWTCEQSYTHAIQGDDHDARNIKNYY